MLNVNDLGNSCKSCLRIYELIDKYVERPPHHSIVGIYIYIYVYII